MKVVNIHRKRVVVFKGVAFKGIIYALLLIDYVKIEVSFIVNHIQIFPDILRDTAIVKDGIENVPFIFHSLFSIRKV